MPTLTSGSTSSTAPPYHGDRLPPVNLARMGIVTRTVLQYKADSQIECVVISEKKVQYQGQVYSWPNWRSCSETEPMLCGVRSGLPIMDARLLNCGQSIAQVIRYLLPTENLSTRPKYVILIETGEHGFVSVPLFQPGERAYLPLSMDRLTRRCSQYGKQEG